MYSGILKRGKNVNPYKKDEDDAEAYDPLTTKESSTLKEKKIAKWEAEKVQKNKTITNYGPDISKWLESAKLVLEEESYLSELPDDDYYSE